MQFEAGNYRVGVAAAELTLILKSDNTLALYASGSAVFQGDSIASATGTATVRYNDTGSDYLAYSVTVGSVTRSLTVEDGQESVSAVGLAVDVSGFVSL